jgi:hypothetical protein
MKFNTTRAALRPPPVVPFKADDVWDLNNLDEETLAELRAGQAALNRPETLKKKLIGFNPPPE